MVPKSSDQRATTETVVAPGLVSVSVCAPYGRALCWNQRYEREEMFFGLLSGEAT